MRMSIVAVCNTGMGIQVLLVSMHKQVSCHFLLQHLQMLSGP